MMLRLTFGNRKIITEKQRTLNLEKEKIYIAAYFQFRSDSDVKDPCCGFSRVATSSHPKVYTNAAKNVFWVRLWIFAPLICQIRETGRAKSHPIIFMYACNASSGTKSSYLRILKIDIICLFFWWKEIINWLCACCTKRFWKKLKKSTRAFHFIIDFQCLLWYNRKAWYAKKREVAGFSG